MKTLPGVSNDDRDDAENDGKSVSSTDSDVTHEYNELEQHYYDKLLSMNKDHLGFLQHDPRFHKETLCNVCGRVFGKTRHLLQHITDKVKSGSDDEENHTELLHELVLAFTSNYQHHFTCFYVPTNHCKYNICVFYFFTPLIKVNGYESVWGVFTWNVLFSTQLHSYKENPD